MSGFTPKETYRKISDISIDYLKNDVGIKGLIFDFDGTLQLKWKISKSTFEFIKEDGSYSKKVEKRTVPFCKNIYTFLNL